MQGVEGGSHVRRDPARPAGGQIDVHPERGRGAHHDGVILGILARPPDDRVPP